MMLSALVDIVWRVYRKSLYYYYNLSIDLKLFLDKFVKTLMKINGSFDNMNALKSLTVITLININIYLDFQ